MDENGAGPSKPLTLKIRIPALKRAQRPPTPPPAPEDASSDESRSASPISIDEAASNVTSALPSAATTSFSLPQPLPNKPKKKPKPKSKLFSRVTTTPRLPPTDPNYVKKLPKLKPLNELLPRLISRLKKKDHYGIFLQPVDTNAFPLYLKVIQFPMDLSTMEKKYETRQYKSLEQFSSDFRLMIRNCQTFNPAPSLYHTEASRLETFGNDIISQAAGQLAEPRSDDDELPLPEVKMEVDTPPKVEAKPIVLPPEVKVHKRSESTVSAAPNQAPPPATPSTATSNAISFAHAEWQKQTQGGPQQQKAWIRGPYKKTVIRDVTGIGPDGELPGTLGGVGEFPVGSEVGRVALALEIRGKRYRTKKEKIELEKRGQPTLWDGSIDYASLEEPFSILHHFTAQPFDTPFLRALTQPPDSGPRNFGISTTAEKLAARTAEISSQLESQAPAFFVQNAFAVTKRPAAAEHDTLEDPGPQYALPERLPLPGDFGLLPTLGPASRESLWALESQRYAQPAAEGALTAAQDGVKYLRDVVYGGTDGLAYARSIMNFVEGARVEDTATAGDEEYDYEESRGGLGMSLKDYISQQVLNKATDGMHDVLVEATKQLRLSDGRYSSDSAITSLLHESLHVNPALRERISTAVQLRKDKIQLADLIVEPTDLTAGDEMWDPDHSASNGSHPTASAEPPKFNYAWAERALGVSAERVESLSGELANHVNGAEASNGSAEDSKLRALRFNLLALARFVPLTEGIQLDGLQQSVTS